MPSISPINLRVDVRPPPTVDRTVIICRVIRYCVSQPQPLGVGQLFAPDVHVVIPTIMLATVTAGCDNTVDSLVLSLAFVVFRIV